MREIVDASADIDSDRDIMREAFRCLAAMLDENSPY
jgi:hypothetical protein